MKIKIAPNPAQATGSIMMTNLVRPEGVKAYSREIGGFERTWKEYVPECYDGSKSVPLVLSFHGGASQNAEVRTALAYIADRENFIILYPQCIRLGVDWNMFGRYVDEPGVPDDVAYIDALIDMMLEKYNIDTTRIYAHGQSAGDLMASYYLTQRSNRFAAAAPLSGPAGAGSYIREDSEIYRMPPAILPVLRTHGSEDVGIPHAFKKPLRPEDVYRKLEPKPRLDQRGGARPGPTEEARYAKMVSQLMVNDYVWKNRNQTPDLPKISVHGKYAELRYEGPEADYVIYYVNGGEHGPKLDMAENVYSYFLSRYRRVDGKIVRGEPNRDFKRERGAIALADGAKLAYVDNEPVEIGGNMPLAARELDGVYYVPVSFLPKAFPGMSCTVSDAGMTAELKYGEDTMSFAVGQGLAVFNEYLKELSVVKFVDSVMYVPIAEIARIFFGWKIASGRGAAYISENDAQMGFDLAFTLRWILGAEDRLGPVDWLAEERAALER